MLDSNLIFLVGMMGCGKSSIGRELARLLKLDFVDLDDEIKKGFQRMKADDLLKSWDCKSLYKYTKKETV